MTTQGDSGGAGSRPPATAEQGGQRLVDARQSLGSAKLDDLFPEGEAYRRSLQTFTALLALASLIAAFGLYQDSVASIIGAMIVAPLGGAIMAFAGSLVTGRTRWQAISLLQVVLGALMVVAIGYLVSWIMPDPLGLTPSLEARTAPGLLDLGVALAAGGAGAYVAVRRTGSDALPGVAIAVSLVPPLATVGICLELGRPADASGALTLFLTNFCAIVVVACIVFILAGAAPSREMLRERHRLRNGFAVAIIGLVIISIPLAVRGIDAIRATIDSTTGAPIVRTWMGDRDLQVTAWSITGNTVSISLSGPDAPAPAAALATSLAQAVGHPVSLEINYTPMSRERTSATP
jgi:uncharacterized hydrophobic protein (TIGR00271 family)